MLETKNTSNLRVGILGIEASLPTLKDPTNKDRRRKTVALIA